MIKVKIFGWKSPPLDVVSRIEEGLQNHGVIFTDENPDLLYKNEDFFDQAIEFKNNCLAKKPVTIFNILDLQVRNPNFNLEKLKEQLLQADIITCISETVKNQIYEYLKLDAHVIYNPVKDITFDNLEKNISFLYVGRANDKNKRFDLIVNAFKPYKHTMDHLYICGSENPMYGNYIGIVDDKNLNTIYNSSKFVLLPSKFEGLGLPMIEAMMAGSIPITCSDNPTALELSPPEFICEPTESDFLNKILELNENYKSFQKIALQYGEKYRELMNKNKIAENIINLYNKHNEGII